MASVEERLPRWNLQKSFGYTSPNDPQIDKDLASYRRFCRGFANRYKGKVAGLSDEELVTAIERYHAGDDRQAQLTTYATMSYERQKNNPTIKAVHDKIYRKIPEAEGLCVYFIEELTNLSEERLRKFKANPSIPRKYKKYVENYVATKHDIVSTSQADAIGMFAPLLEDFEELHGHMIANQQFVLNGRTLDYNTMFHKMRRDPDPKVREAAFNTFIKTVAPSRTTYETIMNSGLKYRANHQDLYNYPHFTDAWNVENDITDPKIPLRMMDAIVSSGITNKFYALKAKLMGKTQLDPWDMHAPLSNLPDRHYSWSEAREIVVSAFTHFHPELGAIAKKAFDEGWIDAPPAKGKYTGLGITYAGSKKFNPHVLVNWQGDFNSLTTLAHEVGHAVALHTQKQKLGNILSSHPRMISELCAYFAERMLGEELERRAQTPQEKCWVKYQTFVSHHMSNMILAHTYERAVTLQKQYLKSGRQRVTSADLDAWFVEGMRNMVGNTARNLEKTGPLWVSDESLFREPFYAGDYPMMSLTAQVLFDKRRSGEIPNLGDRFIKMLHKGEMEDCLKLMKGLGADITEPGFWRKGMNGVQRELDELVQLVAKEKQCTTPPSKFGERVVASRIGARAHAK